MKPYLLLCQDGVYIKGLFLQGAGWDKKNQCLIEATPMQLVCQIPTIHFKPVENKKKVTKGTLLHAVINGSKDGSFKDKWTK